MPLLFWSWGSPLNFVQISLVRSSRRSFFSLVDVVQRGQTAPFILGLWFPLFSRFFPELRFSRVLPTACNRCNQAIFAYFGVNSLLPLCYSLPPSIPDRKSLSDIFFLLRLYFVITPRIYGAILNFLQAKLFLFIILGPYAKINIYFVDLKFFYRPGRRNFWYYLAPVLIVLCLFLPVYRQCYRLLRSCDLFFRSFDCRYKWLTLQRFGVNIQKKDNITR